MAHINLGRLAGLRLTAGYSVLWAFPALWAILAAAGLWLLDLPPLDALLGALAATILHYLGELVHQLGHARAARRSGHPMIGVRLAHVLGTSIYPKDEGDLPAAVHVRRALGGPLASLLVTLVTAGLALALRDVSGSAHWLLIFVPLDNFVVFTLGALTPLGFTDGSTLLTWLPRR